MRASVAVLVAVSCGGDAPAVDAGARDAAPLPPEAACATLIVAGDVDRIVRAPAGLVVSMSETPPDEDPEALAAGVWLLEVGAAPRSIGDAPFEVIGADAAYVYESREGYPGEFHLYAHPVDGTAAAAFGSLLVSYVAGDADFIFFADDRGRSDFDPQPPFEPSRVFRLSRAAAATVGFAAAEPLAEVNANDYSHYRRPVALVEDGDWLYWGVSHDLRASVRRVRKDGAVLAPDGEDPAETIGQLPTEDASIIIYGLAVAGAWGFFLTHDDGLDLASLYRVAKDGGEPQLLGTAMGYPTGFQHRGGHLYWSTRAAEDAGIPYAYLWRAGESVGAPERLYRIDSLGRDVVVEDDTFVYDTDAPRRGLYRHPLAGCP